MSNDTQCDLTVQSACMDNKVNVCIEIKPQSPTRFKPAAQKHSLFPKISRKNTRISAIKVPTPEFHGLVKLVEGENANRIARDFYFVVSYSTALWFFQYGRIRAVQIKTYQIKF